MRNVFFLSQMLKVLHAPICFYDKEGNLVQPLEETTEKPLLGKQDFKADIPFDFPYIHVEADGVTCCCMWSAQEELFVGLGKLRIFDFGDEKSSKYPYCEKEEFTAIVLLIWNMLTGKELGATELWDRNVDIEADFSVKEQAAKGIFKRQVSGESHNPYGQELREQDSIRRGDIEALRRSIDEVYSGKLGVLAKDPVRQYKNLAICVISLSARSAIEGGVNPELAFSLADAFIRNIEDNLLEPVKIEKATRAAEFEFANIVSNLNKKAGDNPLITQVKDYVFCHIHEAIRVRDIAKHVGVTPNYLSEQFSQAMGMSLKQYIIDEKIVSSENLLKYTDYSLQEISAFYAFSSQSRFSAYFQRKNGMTPAKYRKKYKKKENE